MRVTTQARLLAGGAVAGMALVVGLAGPAYGQDTSEVYVVHGIPDQEVDVYVDGELTLEGVTPEEVSDPLELAGGSYDIALTEPGGDPEDPLVESESTEVPDGASVDLAAHLDEEGNPTLTPFVNDTEEVADGQARLTVRHAAAAPEVDVDADGESLVTDLASSDESSTEVEAGTYSVEVLLAGEDTVVIGPSDLELTDGGDTIVYAIGSADEDNLNLLTHDL